MPTSSAYRVFTTIAGPLRKADALDVSPARQGAGRIDNPELYSVIYASSNPSGAVAEAFGNRVVWRDSMFSPREGYVKALAELEIDSKRVLNLDDASNLVLRQLNPSTVITRRRDITQAWARQIFSAHKWIGVSWWSYYEAAWASIGIWSLPSIASKSISILHREHPAVVEAASTMNKPWSEERI